MRRSLGQIMAPGAWVSPPAPGPAPGSAPASGLAVKPTDILVTVFRADDLRPVPGALIRIFGLRGASASIEESAEADERGQYRFVRGARPAGDPDAWRIAVLPGTSGLSFPEKTIDMPRARWVWRKAVAVCPSGTDPLVCEVGANHASYAEGIDWARENYGQDALRTGAVQDLLLTFLKSLEDSRVGPYGGDLLYALTDLGIPPKDWPALVENYSQARRIFDSIPFPKVAEKDWFYRCARGIPLTEGRNGEPLSVANFRLYSPTWSAYFPRSDARIRADMAARYLINMPSILKCVEHKLRRRAEEVQGSARAFGMMGLSASLMLAPMAGAGGFSAFATDLATYAAANLGLGSLAEEGLSSWLSSGIFEGVGPDLAGAVAAGMTTILAQHLEELDAPVRQIVSTAMPEVVETTVREIGLGTLTEGALAFDALQAAGSAAMAFAVKMISNIAVAQGARNAEEFQDIVTGFARLPEAIVPFAVWCMKTLLLDRLYEEAAKRAGISLDANQDIVNPAIDRAESKGVEVPAEATAPGTAETSKKILAVGGIGVAALAVAFATGIIGT